VLCFIAPEILYLDLNFPSGATKSITCGIKNALVRSFNKRSWVNPKKKKARPLWFLQNHLEIE
jgi:hypothetical protein